MGFRISSGYNSPGAVSNWLWSQGYSGIGPSPGSAPPIVKQVLQQPGMQMDPTQYRSVGGYTPQFADLLNQILYPGKNFKMDDASRLSPMTQGLSQPIELGGQVNVAGAPMERTQMVPDISAASPWMTAQMAKQGKSQFDILKEMQQGPQPNPNAGIIDFLRSLIQGGQ